MGIVVDFLADGENYVPTEQKILHVEAFLRLMRALTGDGRYEEIALALTKEEKEEGMKMCKLLDKYENRGMERGMEQGMVRALVGNIRSMYAHKLTAESISELINQKLDYINRIIALCNQYPTADDLFIARKLLAGETKLYS